MKIDEIIEGNKSILVPYEKKYVLKYHNWMKSEYLLEMTASEPLSLEEEYENQISWMNDPLKATFILLDKSIDSNDNIERMCGDVNLFFHKYLQDESLPNHHQYLIGEIEIMIAEEKSRRKGIAQEALNLMIQWSHNQLKTEIFLAKISYKNIASQKLFGKRLGWEEIDRDDTFEEITYQYKYKN